MLLSDIFIALSTGELSQVYLGNNPDGDIELNKQPQLISAINLGLLELHKKFTVREKDLTIQLYSTVETYKLTYDYAVSNTGSSEAYKYIVDTALIPFQDDVLLIHSVYDEEGEELFLNNLDEETSLFTPDNRTLEVPTPLDDTSLKVNYRVKPMKIPVYGTDSATYEVDLPDYLLEPLLFYVASRVSPNIGAVNGEPTYFQKYLASCDNVKQLNLRNQKTFSNEELEKNGWV